ncbi:hypothetical protein FACS1894125_5270 [Actinomycetota bacterium]|nr:hypothetical protein FACS1894125_5270 [Actinomycetota bacterium]
MSIAASKKHKTQKNGNYHEWTYYHCTKRKRAVTCSEPFLREEVLDRQLSELIRKCELSDEGVKFIYEQVAADYEVSAQSQNEVHTDTQEQLENNSRQLAKLTDVYLDDDIDREDYLKRKAELINTKRDLGTKISTKPIQPSEALEPVKEFLKSAKTLGKLADSDDKISKKFACANLAGWNLSLGSALVWVEGVPVCDEARLQNGSKTHRGLATQGKAAAVGARFFGEIKEVSPWRHLFDVTFATDSNDELERWYPQRDLNPCYRRERARY